MSVKDRLIKFLEQENISQGKFEKHVGLSNGFVNNIGAGISTTSLTKIRSKYPSLNVQWLLKGEGEMLQKNTEDFNLGEAVKKTEATVEVILAAVAELLARSTGQSSTIVKEQLEDLVNKRLNPSE
ncbi:hypothetical protein [Chitinophaga pinensis]|uniref:Helix-turn-helix transcriptional regulator n=1 Tax=Chitinophaga pinensis (strain ATCC 43595 / DSM 2588 / LMG 13176 / NBRC 15968 / NCIMB 11800 / UQM 2034) TaxID=485918 RepID=A0A979G5P1_CHIPD|nr:hypothetical protein [Chitinophaga pinensis]ACU61335.1 hypothetical protein Cpin_3873 [Chitinophaga pinensis DSM 2588]